MSEIVYYDGRPWCDGRPVHCGEVIEVLAPPDGWRRVRVERTWTPEGPGLWYWIDAGGNTGRLGWGTLARWPAR